LTKVRGWIVDAIPMDLKRAIGIGIGLFLAIIGLHNAGVVVLGTDATPVVLASDLTTLRMLTFVVGLVLAIGLVARGMRGALLISIVGTTVFATILNVVWGHEAIWEAVGPGVAQMPSDWVSSPDFALVGNFNLSVFSVLGIGTALAAILAVMLSDFFDTAGTVVGIADESGMLDQDGKLPGMQRVLFVDSLAAAAGGVVSASSNTTYIESASGVSAGGRTGLASVVTGALFLLCLFISPIAGVIPPEATAPVLVIVAYFMIQSVAHIDWRDPGIGIPALLTMVMMPFTYSITNGVGVGFLAYVVARTLQGRAREIHPLLWIVSAVFAWYFLRGLLA
jgi:AGZA family xanthine/uracil permease-like MFS transporter